MKLTGLIVLMSCVVGLGYGLAEATHFPLHFSAANAASTGQMAPSLFAPGANWGFITAPQMWILVLATAGLLLLAMLMLVLSVWNRIADMRSPQTKLSSDLTSFMAPREVPPPHRPFGRPR